MVYSRENPSPRYVQLLQQYKQVHLDGLPNQNIAPEQAFAGQSLQPHISEIEQLCRKYKCQSVLDYGSGKGSRYAMRDLILSDGKQIDSVQNYWGVQEIVCYDPAFEPYSNLPMRTFDGVICTDVLEHVPEEDASWMLSEIFRYAQSFVFANVACYQAKKVLPNGENAHCTVQPRSWWLDKVQLAISDSGFAGEVKFVVTEKTPKPKFPQKLWKRQKINISVIDNDALTS